MKKTCFIMKNPLQNYRPRESEELLNVIVGLLVVLFIRIIQLELDFSGL